jgi:hypothetical protein
MHIVMKMVGLHKTKIGYKLIVIKICNFLSQHLTQ